MPTIYSAIPRLKLMLSAQLDKPLPVLFRHPPFRLHADGESGPG
ncbi:MAG: hypothetical protein QF886_07965 [Planctomycetota bacterium]|nr:hypothetical protein [Planctomycetota bacterium]